MDKLVLYEINGHLGYLFVSFYLSVILCWTQGYATYATETNIMDGGNLAVPRRNSRLYQALQVEIYVFSNL